MADNSALQKAPKLTLDEARQATLFLLSASQEGLQVLLDDLVQQGLLGLTPLILDGLSPLRDRGAHLDGRNFGAGLHRLSRARSCTAWC